VTHEQQRAAIKLMMQRHNAKVTVDARTALASLVEDGLYTPEGDLAPQFGGEKKNLIKAR